MEGGGWEGGGGAGVKGWGRVGGEVEVLLLLS